MRTTFASPAPYDDHIDKPTYFDRCWKNSDWIERHELERIVVDGDEAFVTYKCTAKGGKSFRNTEFFCVRRRQGQKHRRVFWCELSGRRVRQAAGLAVPRAPDAMRHEVLLR